MPQAINKPRVPCEQGSAGARRRFPVPGSGCSLHVPPNTTKTDCCHTLLTPGNTAQVREIKAKHCCHRWLVNSCSKPRVQGCVSLEVPSSGRTAGETPIACAKYHLQQGAAHTPTSNGLRESWAALVTFGSRGTLCPIGEREETHLVFDFLLPSPTIGIREPLASLAAHTHCS